MTTTHLIYLLLLTAAFVVSLVANKFPTTLRIFPYLLGLSILVELMVNIIHHGLGIEQGYLPIYHFYVVVEYALLAFFFYSENRNSAVKRMIMGLSLAYIAALFIIYLYPLQTLQDHPGHSYNVGGVFLILMSIVTLFMLEPIPDLPIFKHPVFWICVGMIIFYSGVVVFNGIYNYLRATYQLTEAEILLQTIVKGANYILYLSLIRAFQCSHQMKR